MTSQPQARFDLWTLNHVSDSLSQAFSTATISSKDAIPADENEFLLLDTQLKYDSVKFLNNMYDIHEEWDNPMGICGLCRGVGRHTCNQRVRHGPATDTPCFLFESRRAWHLPNHEKTGSIVAHRRCHGGQVVTRCHVKWLVYYPHYQ